MNNQQDPPQLFAPTPVLSGYHVHIYYASKTKEQLTALLRRLRDSEVGTSIRSIGQCHDRPVGPHPCPSVQIDVAPEAIAKILPWLALNRGELTVYIHLNTGDELWDHVHNTIWMGEMLELVNLECLENPNHRDLDEMRAYVKKYRSR